MINLALNATGLLSQFTGIGQYTYNLARQFNENDQVSLDLFYGAYWSKNLKNEAPFATTNILNAARKYVPYSYEIRSYIQESRFKRHLKKSKIDIYHEPSVTTINVDIPTVTTIHDISWLHYPNFHPKARVRSLNNQIDDTLKQVNHIITDSDFVKHELVTHLSVPESKITTISLAADKGYYPRVPETTSTTMAKFKLEHGRYFLLLGTLEPRKNHRFAIDAYLKLPAHLRSEYPLVHVGGNGWLGAEDRSFFETQLTSNTLRTLGFVQQSELYEVVAGAHALLFPSIYEGFGLPVLEAMASGVPVIATDSSSIPEVLGDTGILVQQGDIDVYTASMHQIISDFEFRNAMARRALARSKTFDWKQTADQTLKVYQRVIG